MHKSDILIVITALLFILLGYQSFWIASAFLLLLLASVHSPRAPIHNEEPKEEVDGVSAAVADMTPNENTLKKAKMGRDGKEMEEHRKETLDTTLQRGKVFHQPPADAMNNLLAFAFDDMEGSTRKRSDVHLVVED